MKLDEFLPKYDFNEVHTVKIHASPENTMTAVKELRPSQLSPLIFLMLSIRDLPARIFGKLSESESRETTEEPFLKQMLAGGFGLLAETDQEIVFGLIGKFWELTGGEEIEISDPQFFLDFNQTDFAKVAANLMVRANGDKTILSTETRVWAPDKRTRRKFAFYWRLISLGSGWIRVMWLNAIKRRAERTRAADNNP